METRRTQKYRSRLTLDEFNKKYGELAFGEFEDILKELDKSGFLLKSPDTESIASIAGDDIAQKIEMLRAKIFGADGKTGLVDTNHQQDFNRFMGQVMGEVYGKDSAQVKNARVVLYHAASEATKFVKMILSGLEMFGMNRALPANRAEDILALVRDAEPVFRFKRAETEQEMHKNAPNPEDFPGNTRAYIAAKVTKEKPFQERLEKIGKLLGACSWLKKAFAETKPITKTDAEPPKDKKSELKEKIQELEDEMKGFNANAQTAIASGNLAAAQAAIGRAAEAQAELIATKAEIETLEAVERDNARIAATAAVATTAPPRPGEATGTMPGAVRIAPTQKEVKLPESLEEVVALITRLEKELETATAASDRHYTDAKVLYADADAIRNNRQKAASLDKEGGKLEASGAKAKQAAEKIKTRLDAAKAKKTEFEKAAKSAVVTPPQAEPKKRVRLAGRKPAAEPVVAAPGAVTPDGQINKLTLIKAIKAATAELGADTVKNLNARISAGEDLAAVAEEFAAMTS